MSAYLERGSCCRRVKVEMEETQVTAPYWGVSRKILHGTWGWGWRQRSREAGFGRMDRH